MTAAQAIFAKDGRELLRDGRALLGLGLVLLLGLAAFWLSAQRIEASEAARTAAAAQDRQTWEGQGAANPHSVAHFSAWAFKPQTALSAFEPGLTPYLGEAVWMEAHYRNPANFRPAEDAADARRFADLSPAWLVAAVLPLGLIAIGFGSLAREREGGQWRQMLGAGVSAVSVLQGKAGLLLALGLGLAALVTLPAIAATSGLPAPADAAARWALIVAAVLLYAAAIVGTVLAASAASRTSRGALLALIGFWMVAVVLVPRLAATAAETLAPTPPRDAFWGQVQADMEEGIDGHSASDARRKRLEAETLARYGVARVEDLPINFGGLALQASEAYGDRVFDRRFGELRAAQDRQQAVVKLAGLLSPAVAFRNATAALAGTDVAHHWHFTDAAEVHRRRTVKMLNDDLTHNGGPAGFDYKADPALWATIPEFAYATPPWTVSRGGLLDLAILGVWGLAGFAAAAVAVRRWRAA